MASEKYKGVEIVYSEIKDKWVVEDDTYGISLERGSLREAKKALDLALRKSGKGAFKRFKAWKKGRGWGSTGDWELVEVTSLVEKYRHYPSDELIYDEAWITYPKTSEHSRANREKVQIHRLFADTPKNAELIGQMQELSNKIQALTNTVDELHQQLAPIESDPEVLFERE